MRRKLITSSEAVPATRQHDKPCSDCPWRRKSLAGWLGSMSVDEWLRAAHGESRIDCHALLGAQCAGAATYRTNVCKTPRDPALLVLPANRARVFASPMEFERHHSGAPENSRGGRS
jgi:hypothetical protein